ncbi:MAG: glycosyltransferase family 4 protein, partial [bacterium]|nr:glycosyltransferase family 4 protein [bacterium]
EKIDLYYTVHYIVDLDLPVPYIYTIHDLVRLKHPEHSYTDETFRARFGEQEFQRIQRTLASLGGNGAGGEVFLPYFWAINRHQVRRSAHAVTVSELCRNDIVTMLGAPPEKVSVVSNAVDAAVFYPRRGPEVHEVRERLGVPAGYCLYVGLAHPHKRVPWLLEVWAVAVDRLPPDVKLVLVCSDSRARGLL